MLTGGASLSWDPRDLLDVIPTLSPEEITEPSRSRLDGMIVGLLLATNNLKTSNRKGLWLRGETGYYGKNTMTAETPEQATGPSGQQVRDKTQYNL